ncbi:aminotransferase class I/II-fold pyridoxal phosphate-dependent enzyme [Actinoplanes sp. NPDC049316]|uniref:DegT/DnrJ/EryC1/StrS family aminotransferase n=1 Tax=Actinoplanes sp. NPDC049316 TaxID=3154727 RepID=UPI0034122AD0
MTGALRLTEDLEQLLDTMPDPAAGTQVTALESELADRFGVRHAVAVSSGTAALHTALRAVGVGPGDEVLVPALTVIMSVAPIIHAGARPVFVDCTPDGADLDHTDLSAKVTPATKAVLPVHLWGRIGDLARLGGWADEHRLLVVEDACQAQGSRTGDRHAGTGSAIGCFSMKDGKVLWCGEGGYLLTDNDRYAAAARSYRSHGLPPPPPGYPPQVAQNYRLAEPLAVIARANLARLDDLLARRQHQAALLRELLTDAPGVQPAAAPGQGWNGYSFLATLTMPRPRAFCERLAGLGIPNSVGTFRLVPADQRRELASFAASPCGNAAAVIDRTLAVILTDHDDDQRITGYAEIIAREARAWCPRD